VALQRTYLAIGELAWIALAAARQTPTGHFVQAAPSTNRRELSS
jgi:hypothetical protein